MSFKNILTIKQIIQSENNFFEKKPSKDLMRIAVEKLFNEISKEKLKKKILIISGPGNNGNDGSNFFNLFRKNFKQIKLVKLYEKNNILDLGILIENSDIIIDCIFGIGLKRKINGIYKETIKKINRSNSEIYSFDLPSGINADSGLIEGIAVKATETFAIGFYKPCHFLLPGKEYCGNLKLVDIGLKTSNKRLPKIVNISNQPEFKKTKNEGLAIHKYKKGSVLVFGGKMAGASRLAALSARKVGAGLSRICIEKKNLDFYSGIEPGTIVELFSKSNKKCSSLIIGPGLGLKFKKKKIIENIENDIPTIFDADIFGIFAKNSSQLIKILNKRKNSVLTPHNGEFKRFFKFKGTNKIELSLKAASISNSIIIYKGNDTVIASPNGKVWVNSNAKNSLATAGSGDILSGIIAGLISQGFDIEKASILAVWIHGKLSHNKNNVIAEDFINDIPNVYNSLKY